MTGQIKTVKVRPVNGNLPPSMRRLPMVLLAAIRNVYNIGWKVKRVGAGHYRMETYLCTVDYTIPEPSGQKCLMQVYRKKEIIPDKEPFCVAQYILEEK